MEHKNGSIWAPLQAFLKHPMGQAVLIATAIFLIFTPGYMSNDSLSHYSGAGQLDNLTLYHPPTMSWLFAIGRWFSDDQSGVLAVQLALYFGGALFLLSTLFSSRKFILAGLLLVGFFPPLFSILGVLWKSVWMTAFLFLALGLAVRAIRKPTFPRIAATIASVLMCCLVRFEAGAPAGIILFTIAVSLFISRNSFPIVEGPRTAKIKQLAALTGMSLLVSLTVWFGVLKSVSATNDAITVNNMHPSHVFLYQDLLNISVITNEVWVPEYIRSENPGLTVAQLKTAFIPKTCNGFLRKINRPAEEGGYALRRPASAEEAEQFHSVWRAAIRKHPVPYIKARLAVLKPMWGAGKHVEYPYQIGVANNSLGLDASITGLNATAKEWSDYWARDIKLLHKPWIYVALCMLLIALLVRTLIKLTRDNIDPEARAQRYSHIAIAGLITVCGLVHFFTVSIVSCSADFRFAFFLIAASLLAMLYSGALWFAPGALRSSD